MLRWSPENKSWIRLIQQARRMRKGPVLSEVQTENKPRDENSSREPWQNGNKASVQAGHHISLLKATFSIKNEEPFFTNSLNIQECCR